MARSSPQANSDANIPAVVERAIDQRFREVIATVDDLRRGQVEVVGRMADQVGGSLEKLLLHLDLKQREVLYGLGAIHRTSERAVEELEDIRRTLKAPSRTFAYEQYEAALRANSLGMKAEARRAIELAIHGGPGQVGYEVEHRFHLLKGELLLAENELLQAEESFARAGLCAGSENARDSGAAFELAAECAFKQNDLEGADEYLRQAVDRTPSSGSAWYWSARTNASMGNQEVAGQQLTKAYSSDRRYAFDAFSSDVGLVNDDGWLDSWLAELVALARGGAVQVRDELDLLTERALQWKVYGDEHKEVRAEFDRLHGQGTLFGYQDAAQVGSQLEAQLRMVVDKEPVRLGAILQERAEEVHSRISSAGSRDRALLRPLEDFLRAVWSIANDGNSLELRSQFDEKVRILDDAEAELKRHLEQRAPVIEKEDSIARAFDAALGAIPGVFMGLVAGAFAFLMVTAMSFIAIGIVGTIMDWPGGTAARWCPRVGVLGGVVTLVVVAIDTRADWSWVSDKVSYRRRNR